MKRFFLLILVSCLLVGCTTQRPIDKDVLLQTTKDEYKFELWQKPDGDKYLKNPANGKIMELPNL